MAIKNLQQADTALEKIAEMRMKAHGIAAERLKQTQKILAPVEKKVNKINMKAEQELADLHQQISKHEQELADYETEHHDELFVEKKSVRLVCGELGVRTSRSLQTSETTLEKCKRYHFDDAIKITESIRKNILSTYTDATLEKLDAANVNTDSYFYKLNNDGQATVIRKVDR